ncbi:hypothetical protein LIER_12100 [Lithospermum erythrorhizon]|uniref:Uncharacterized protein n=1 Tax=Lithospermum erythrorhizon TaxID=34254 RepID=A0AAV3PQF3_LITER
MAKRLIKPMIFTQNNLSFLEMLYFPDLYKVPSGEATTEQVDHWLPSVSTTYNHEYTPPDSTVQDVLPKPVILESKSCRFTITARS